MPISQELFKCEGYYLDNLKSSGIVYDEVESKNRFFDKEFYCAVNESLFQGHNYCYDSSGNLEEMKKATLKECFKYYKKYYTLRNIVFIIFGEIDIKEELKNIVRIIYKK